MTPSTIRPFAGRLAPVPQRGGFRQPDHWVWCGSVIGGEDGRYHMYASRWPKAYPFFDGYRVASEVIHAVAETPVGPYAFQSVVLPDRGEAYWDGRMTHNPSILRIGDQYALFYIGATYRGARPAPDELHAETSPVPDASYATIRIGLATSDAPEGPWKRRDTPIISSRRGHWDASVITNPAPCLAPDGRLLVYYRGNLPRAPGVRGGRIGLAAAPGIEQPFERLTDEPILAFGPGRIEDPYVWWNGTVYELVAKDLTGELTGEFHAGIHAWSTDAISWNLGDPPKAWSRTIQWDDGRSTTLGSLERPQILLEAGVPTHVCFAVADGPGGFRDADNTWNVVVRLDQ